MDNHSIITSSASETQEAGRRLSASLAGGEVIALFGDLGSGKTTFVQGFAEGLGVTERILSPTFIIMRSYQTKSGILYHADLYRLEEDASESAKEIGLLDTFEDKNAIVIIEWAERIEALLPKDTIRVHLKHIAEEKREIIYE